ncbi:hypothetical protein V8B97DRAFT_1914540 [Scleroderma yunnanense]
MSWDDAYGFVNPASVLRGCHLIPVFARGRMPPDGVPVSQNARDGTDWKHYYVNRGVTLNQTNREHESVRQRELSKQEPNTAQTDSNNKKGNRNDISLMSSSSPNHSSVTMLLLDILHESISISNFHETHRSELNMSSKAI